MNVRVLIVLLLISVVLAFMPRFRRIGVTASALLVALLLWVNIREAQQPDELEPTINKQSKTDATTALIASPHASIVALQLEGRGAPWRLTGSVRNVGTVPIKSLRLKIERYDCPTVDTTLSDCSVLWQGEHVARPSIAAGATSKLDESFYSHVAVPLSKGIVRDQIVIADAG